MTGSAAVVVGTVVATLSAYAFQLLGGRLLGPAEFAPLTVLWTLQFVLMYALYQPIEQYAIRQIELGRGLDRRLVVVCLTLAAVLVAAFVIVTADMLFAGDRGYVPVAVAMTFGYGVFALVRARLGGRRRFGAYGMATAAEGLLRLVVAVLVVGVMGASAGFGWAMALAPLAVLGWAGPVSIGRREPATRLLLPLMGAGLCAQLLIGAAPVAAGFLGASPALVSVVFVTFALLRAPLWILHGLSSRILPPLTALAAAGDAGQLRSWSRRISLAGVLIAATGGALGAWFGPAIVAGLFGPEFRPSRVLSGLVATGVLLTAAGMLNNQILVALGRTTYLSAAWSAGLAAALLTILLPGAPDVRVGVAFLVGQAVSLAILATGIGRVCARGGSRAPLVVARPGDEWGAALPALLARSHVDPRGPR